MTSSIRLLEARDLPELVQLCREHAEYERALWDEFERADKLGALFLDSEGARCWVVEGTHGLVGFASATLERSTWDADRFLHLDCIYLRPASRGRGLGRALIDGVARTAVELGAVNLQWQTPAWNEDAIRFYRRLGATAAEKLRFTMTAKQCAKLIEDTSAANADTAD